jgi:hypothetical protein
MLNHIKIASLSLAMTTFQECPIFCPKVRQSRDVQAVGNIHPRRHGEPFWDEAILPWDQEIASTGTLRWFPTDAMYGVATLKTPRRRDCIYCSFHTKLLSM